MTASPKQLVLDLPCRPALGAEDFLVSASNDAAVTLVDRWPDWPAGAAVISGPAGSGKSHLANVWRLKCNARVAKAAAITEQDVPALAGPSAARGALVIEDLDRGIASEQALFHILNLVREQRLAVLLTTSKDPGDLTISLPDLRSRLRALAVARIEPPDDALLRAVLVKLFADRQLSVEPGIVDYMLVRMERSLDSARYLVGTIDKLALAMHRGVTRAIVSTALQERAFPPLGEQ